MPSILCTQCGKESNIYGIKGHVWRVHTDAGRLFGSGTKGITTALKGRRLSEAHKQAMRAAKLGMPGRPLSQETKDKISKSRIAYLTAHPDKVPYRLAHSSKESYPEKLFREELSRQGVTGWTQKYRQSIYEYDFAFVSLKIDVEIDGHTHTSAKVAAIDKRRDEYSAGLGWTVVRIPAKTVIANPSQAVKHILALLA